MRKMLILENVGLEVEMAECICRLVLIFVICFVLWLAFKFVLVDLFNLVLQFPWLSSFRLLAMVSAYAQSLHFLL